VSVDVRFRLWNLDAKPPAFQRDGDACADLCAWCEEGVTVVWPGKTAVVYSGVSLEIPPGYEGLVRGRSGLTSKGIHVQQGVIDATYRGRIGIIVANNSDSPFRVLNGERVAQLAIRPVPEVRFVESMELSTSVRGEAGFGSSGTH
jgi:dUTP pyrophosphatase